MHEYNIVVNGTIDKQLSQRQHRRCQNKLCIYDTRSAVLSLDSHGQALTSNIIRPLLRSRFICEQYFLNKDIANFYYDSQPKSLFNVLVLKEFKKYQIYFMFGNKGKYSIYICIEQLELLQFPNDYLEEENRSSDCLRAG